MNKGLYIVFEGQDGSGKSMQAEKICKRLNDAGHQTVQFREPGGQLNHPHEVGEKIRQIVQDRDNHINAMCELALFTANRAQLMDDVKKFTEQGMHVLCDRNFLSSVVYQGYGRGLSVSLILEITQQFGILLPDFVALYTVALEQSKQRLNSRSEGLDRFEAENDAFLARVQVGYHQLGEVCDRLSIPHICLQTDDHAWDDYEKCVFEQILVRINN
ncbi:MAG: dTMP kinase [Hyphomonadaceae bacterium]|nr:dTMP kinase [Clostridia bacterium]